MSDEVWPLRRRVRVKSLKPGTMLWDWTRQARVEQKQRYQNLMIGPEGVWSSMVVSNVEELDPLGMSGDKVNIVTVLFTNDGLTRLSAMTWAPDSKVTVIV